MYPHVSVVCVCVCAMIEEINHAERQKHVAVGMQKIKQRHTVISMQSKT